MRTVDPLNEPLPTVSLLFLAAIDIHVIWLQFVPVLVATIWAVTYFRRSNWSWTDQGLLVLTVSVMVAPYAFVTDEAVVLPSILFALYVLRESSDHSYPSSALCCLLWLKCLQEGVNSFWYVWTAPAWFGFYLYATRSGHALRTPDEVAA